MTYEKVADELESASQLQQQMNDAGRAACSAALAPETGIDEDGKPLAQLTCIDCAEELPPVRVAYKRVRCAVCQTEKERLAKLGRV